MQTALVAKNELHGFSPNLSWSHYLTLSRVENPVERRFYEIEAESVDGVFASWNGRSQLALCRLLKSRDKAGVLALAAQGQVVSQPIDVIKQPTSWIFLTCQIERNFANRIWKRRSSRTATVSIGVGQGVLSLPPISRDDRVAALLHRPGVYNYLLKCFVLIDLKIGAWSIRMWVMEAGRYESAA